MKESRPIAIGTIAVLLMALLVPPLFAEGELRGGLGVEAQFFDGNTKLKPLTYGGVVSFPLADLISSNQLGIAVFFALVNINMQATNPFDIIQPSRNQNWRVSMDAILANEDASQLWNLGRVRGTGNDHGKFAHHYDPPVGVSSWNQWAEDRMAEGDKFAQLGWAANPTRSKAFNCDLIVAGGKGGRISDNLLGRELISQALLAAAAGGMLDDAKRAEAGTRPVVKLKRNKRAASR